VFDLVRKRAKPRANALEPHATITTASPTVMTASKKWQLIRRYWFELALGIAIAAVAAYGLFFSHSYYFHGSFTFHSLITYAACFTLCSFFLNRQGVGLTDRLLYSLATMAAGIVLYEIVYHYAYGVSVPLLVKNATFFGLDSGNGAFPLIWFLMTLAIPFLGRRYMGLNRPLFALIAFEAVVMFVWIGAGYPQAAYPSWWPAHAPIFHFIKPTDGPGTIVFYGEVFSNMAKVIAVIPSFFFNKK
jgi:hypothetical protein